MNTQARPPRAVAARNARASVCMLMDSSLVLDDFGGVERGREPIFFTEIPRALPEPRPPDSGRAVPADDLAVRVLADHVVEEYVLGDDGVAFHAHHLGDVGDAARTVAQARSLDNDVDLGADHLADGARGQGEAAHRDHGFAA